MSVTPVIAREYPYEIPGAQVDKAILKKVDPWSALEFLRVEALLRSEEVQRLYRKNATGRLLYKRYRIIWDMLNGFHHHLLSPATMEDKGIADMDKWKELSTGARRLLNPIRDDPARFIHLQLDCAVPPATLVKTLMPLLTERHRHITVGFTAYGLARRHPKKRPPILDVAAWLNYLKCYDLRQCAGLTFGQIAEQVFGATVGRGEASRRKRRTRYDQAERGYKAIKRLIKAAVENRWPPVL